MAQTSEPPGCGESRTAIVTGGAGAGIGGGISEALVAHGWRVLVVDVDAEQVESLRRRHPDVDCMVADITLPDTPQAAVDHALANWGRLDGLVNNAGIGLAKPVPEITDEEFDRLFAVDFCAAFRFARAAFAAIVQSRGAIVNIGSVHARCTVRGYAVYAGVKAALEGFTRGLAADLGPLGARANCVHPGLVSSPQNRDLIARITSDVDAWFATFLATKQLVPELTTARQVGELVCYLLGPNAAAITGQAFTIDGGATAMLFERENRA